MYLEFKFKVRSIVFSIVSGKCLRDFVVFLDEIVESSDEEETDGNYTFGFNKLCLVILIYVWFNKI